MAETAQKKIWDDFVVAHQIAESGVPLFATEALNVLTKHVGKTYIRQVLRRSDEMEALIEKECGRLVLDWELGAKQFDGLIYMMYRKSNEGDVIPLYIGKTETTGKQNGNLSANIKGLQRDKSKFARWGDGHQYHIGDLSAATLTAYPVEKIQPKYRNWSQSLFRVTPSDRPVLKAPVYFWAKAWKPTDVSIWREFSPTRLTFLEYQLIGVTSTLFPRDLLNEEGQNRA